MNIFKAAAPGYLPVGLFDAEAFAVRVRRVRRRPARHRSRAGEQLTVNGRTTRLESGPGGAPAEPGRWMGDNNNLEGS